MVHDKDPSIYHFSDWGSPTGDKYKESLYLLPAVAGLGGGSLRVCNSFMTQCCGGRNVTFSTTILLALPMLLAALKLRDPDVEFRFLLICSLLSGVGGGAMSSSMSNLSFFYPKRLQGYSLGMNGGIGSLGVSISQLLVPVFIDVLNLGVSSAGWFWFIVCIPSAIAAFMWMNNMPAHGEKSIWLNLRNFWWMEIVGLIASFLSAMTLVATYRMELFKSLRPIALCFS